MSTILRDIDATSYKGVLPEFGPCIYIGEFATLFGSFTQVRDNDGHIFEAGRAVEICEKTSHVMNFPLYKRLFAVVNCARQRPDAQGDMVRIFQGRSSRKIQDEFPQLGKVYRGRHFWAIGYAAFSSGHVTNEMIQEYLAHHNNHPNHNDDEFRVE